ncbi:MAG TPA: 1-deoxy-D-xylulose-5-phosphate synthase [Spirochaetota bacterium]|nr:1-deoxy-D-xylulose-5-phosphate synthase [Spirochaetota bacterium]
MNDSNQLLSKITSFVSLKSLSPEELIRLAGEIRSFIIDNVSKTGGHLASSLGVVEITLALHHVLDLPKDKIIWDVGHQCYAHKILTGRKERFHTLRQYDGISGFPSRKESEYDCYGTGHASTSISAALGMAKARDIKKENFRIVAVIGDGSFTGGNALEAVNQAGYLGTPIIIVLNDNRMSISKNVGAFSEYTHRIERTEVYKNIKHSMNRLIENAGTIREELISLKQYIKEVGAPGLLFEKLGINYIGPVDGHNIGELLDAFQRAAEIHGPVLIHCKTVKGKGYHPAEENKSRFHGVSPFDAANGNDLKKNTGRTFTDVFAETMVKVAEKDPSVIAITAAMPDGTGLSRFKDAFPDRFFDVGIAEQHAVVFAAGMASQGFKPVCAIYSTFLQRAYDAIIHDVCLQGLPVLFAIDRAGIVGNDGPTHHGSFDISFLRHIPNLTIMAPRSENELEKMILFYLSLGKPAAIRFPRGNCMSIGDDPVEEIEIGRCEILRSGDDLTVISCGSVFSEVSLVVDSLNMKGIGVTFLNVRFIKPLDRSICSHIRKTGRVLIVEENSVQGGVGSAVLEMCAAENIKASFKLIGLPDIFIEHGDQSFLRKKYGLSHDAIFEESLRLLQACK